MSLRDRIPTVWAYPMVIGIVAFTHFLISWIAPTVSTVGGEDPLDRISMEGLAVKIVMMLFIAYAGLRVCFRVIRGKPISVYIVFGLCVIATCMYLAVIGYSHYDAYFAR